MSRVRSSGPHGSVAPRSSARLDLAVAPGDSAVPSDSRRRLGVVSASTLNDPPGVVQEGRPRRSLVAWIDRIRPRRPRTSAPRLHALRLASQHRGPAPPPSHLCAESSRAPPRAPAPRPSPAALAPLRRALMRSFRLALQRRGPPSHPLRQAASEGCRRPAPTPDASFGP